MELMPLDFELLLFDTNNHALVTTVVSSRANARPASGFFACSSASAARSRHVASGRGVYDPERHGRKVKVWAAQRLRINDKIKMHGRGGMPCSEGMDREEARGGWAVPAYLFQPVSPVRSSNPVCTRCTLTRGQRCGQQSQKLIN